MGSFVMLASLLLTVPALGQTQQVKPFKRAPAPSRQVTLNVDTGVYTRGAVAHDRGASTVADFQNLDAFDGATTGYLSVDTGGGACRWFSTAAKGWGVNQSQNMSDLMSDVVFSYCSSALDQNSAGAGGSATLGFYEGYTLFGGAVTTSVAVVALTGMPAHSAERSFFAGGATCYELRVVFPTLVTFADRTFIGYSWQFEDVGTDGVLANTYPYLACVVSCSGTNLNTGSAGGAGTATGWGEDGQGMLDAIDQFCTTPVTRRTFTFGTAGTPFAPRTMTSINMQVQEAADLAATNVNYNASCTPNADTLSATPAVLGRVWTATLNRGTPSVAGSLFVLIQRARLPHPNGRTPSPPVTGRLLIGGGYFGSASGVHNGTTGSVAAAIPIAFDMLGKHFAAQCRTSGGGIRLSSAVEGTIGTFFGPTPDVIAPQLCCPTEIAVLDERGNGHGEIVNYVVTAVDDRDLTPTIVCVPPSGTTFPLGTTVVTCTAIDDRGNQSQCTFPVRVELPTRLPSFRFDKP